MNEQEAKEKGIDYELTRFGIDDLDRAIADGTAVGFIKVLTVPGKDKILGVTIVGAHGGDLLTEFVLAMKHGLGSIKSWEQSTPTRHSQKQINMWRANGNVPTPQKNFSCE